MFSKDVVIQFVNLKLYSFKLAFAYYPIKNRTFIIIYYFECHKIYFKILRNN